MGAFFAGALTALVGGVVAAYVTYRLNAGKEHVFHMRKKVEELFLAFERYDATVGAYLIPYFSLFRDEITCNQLLDMQRDTHKGGSGDDHKQMVMLISIHFPELRSHLKTYMDAFDVAKNIIAEHKREYKEMGHGTRDYVAAFRQALTTLTPAAESFRDAVAREGQQLAATTALLPQLRANAAPLSQVFNRLSTGLDTAGRNLTGRRPK